MSEMAEIASMHNERFGCGDSVSCVVLEDGEERSRAVVFATKNSSFCNTPPEQRTGVVEGAWVKWPTPSAAHRDGARAQALQFLHRQLKQSGAA